MKRTLQGNQIVILSDDEQNDKKQSDREIKKYGILQVQFWKQNDYKDQDPRKLKKQQNLQNKSNLINYSEQKSNLQKQIYQKVVLNNNQIKNGQSLQEESNFAINLETNQLQQNNKQKDDQKQHTKVLKNPQSYFMPLQINRTAKRYDHLTWKWIGNKKQLWISRFKGTKCHFIPAFLDFTIPSQGKHILRMQITRSEDYKIYFGITTQKAVYLQWTNIIPQPFIAFSFQRCCIIQKPFKQNTTMKQIIPNFTKVYNHIQMQVDMQNFLITFSLKKNKKYKVYQELPQSFIKQAQISDKQENVRKKLYGLVPFVGLQTDYDQFKFLSEE